MLKEAVQKVNIHDVHDICVIIGMSSAFPCKNIRYIVVLGCGVTHVTPNFIQCITPYHQIIVYACVNIALRRFCIAISRQKQARSWDYLYLILFFLLVYTLIPGTTFCPTPSPQTWPH